MLIRILKTRMQRFNDERIERGRFLGRREGAAQVLRRQLELKFGVLPASYLSRIRDADESMLIRWSERALMAVNLSAVFEGMDDGLVE